MPEQNPDPEVAVATSAADSAAAVAAPVVGADASAGSDSAATAAAGATEGRAKIIGNGVAWLAAWSGRWILIAIGLWILGQVVAWTWSILMPLALALILCTALAPLVSVLKRRLKFPPALAAATALLGGIGVLVWIGFMVVPSVADQTGEIANDAAEGITHLQKWLADSNLLSSDQLNELLTTLQEKLKSSADKIASSALTGVGVATGLIITVVTALFLTFLFLKDGERFLPWVRKVSGPSVGPHLTEVLSRSWNTLSGFIRTQAIVSLIDAIFIGAGLLIIGVPLAVPLAIITFFGGFIPIVGAFAAGAIAVLVALVSNGVSGALWVILVVLLVQQLEGNVLSPMLQSKSMNLHAAIVLLSVSLGGTLFGIAGAFLAVPVVAVIAVVLRYLDEQVGIATGELPPTGYPPVEEKPSWIQRLVWRFQHTAEEEDTPEHPAPGVK